MNSKKRRNYIRRISTRQRLKNADYIAAKKAFLKEHPICAMTAAMILFSNFRDIARMRFDEELGSVMVERQEQHVHDLIEIADVYKDMVANREKFQAVDIHHTRGKVGALLTYQPLWLPVSREAHTILHNNIRNAYELGFLFKPWNKQP